METYDIRIQERIQTPERMVAFFEEINYICKKFNLSISHEDGQGGFIIEKYDKSNIEWLCGAFKDYDENEVKTNE